VVAAVVRLMIAVRGGWAPGTAIILAAPTRRSRPPGSWSLFGAAERRWWRLGARNCDHGQSRRVRVRRSVGWPQDLVIPVRGGTAPLVAAHRPERWSRSPSGPPVLAAVVRPPGSWSLYGAAERRWWRLGSQNGDHPPGPPVLAPVVLRMITVWGVSAPLVAPGLPERRSPCCPARRGSNGVGRRAAGFMIAVRGGRRRWWRLSRPAVLGSAVRPPGSWSPFEASARRWRRLTAQNSDHHAVPPVLSSGGPARSPGRLRRPGTWSPSPQPTGTP